MKIARLILIIQHENVQSSIKMYGLANLPSWRFASVKLELNYTLNERLNTSNNGN
jgi:hypothetical protein